MTVTTAEMAQLKISKGGGALLLAVAAIALVGLTGKKSGDDGGVDLPPGPVQLLGGISTVNVNRDGGRGLRMRQGARMATHLLAKESGAMGAVRVVWNHKTVDGTGAVIPSWPWRLQIYAGVGLSGGESATLGRSFDFPGPFNIDPNVNGRRDRTFIAAVGPFFGTPDGQSTVYDVLVTLRVQGSTSAGAPNGVWQTIDTALHRSAVIVRTVAESSGNIETIDVSRRGRSLRSRR